MIAQSLESKHEENFSGKNETTTYYKLVREKLFFPSFIIWFNDLPTEANVMISGHTQLSELS